MAHYILHIGLSRVMARAVRAGDLTAQLLVIRNNCMGSYE